jgi:hypothetical protein
MTKKLKKGLLSRNSRKVKKLDKSLNSKSKTFWKSLRSFFSKNLKKRQLLRRLWPRRPK